MTPSHYNRAMAYVRAVLFAERIKTALHWFITIFYIWLFAEVVWYYGSVGLELAPPMPLFIGGPVLLVVTSVRIIRRIRRGF